MPITPASSAAVSPIVRSYDGWDPECDLGLEADFILAEEQESLDADVSCRVGTCNHLMYTLGAGSVALSSPREFFYVETRQNSIEYIL